MSKAVGCLPSSMAQWLPTSGQLAKTTAQQASRLVHVLQHHFKPPQPAHIMPAGRLSHGHPGSANSNPRVVPYEAAPPTIQLQPSQKQGCGRRAAKAAGALLRDQDERSRGVPSKASVGPEHSARVHATQKGPLLGQLPSAERPLHSAGSHAAPAAKGRLLANGRTEPRDGSVSPNSQYHFSCTSSVPDHGSSCFGDAASQVLQDWPGMAKRGTTHHGKGRQAAKQHVQLPSSQGGWGRGEGATSPIHTTYMLSPQHGMLPVHGLNARQVPNSQGCRHPTPAGRQQQEQAHGDGTGSHVQQPLHADGVASDMHQAVAAATLKPSPGGLVEVQWLECSSPCMIAEASTQCLVTCGTPSMHDCILDASPAG